MAEKQAKSRRHTLESIMVGVIGALAAFASWDALHWLGIVVVIVVIALYGEIRRSLKRRRRPIDGERR